MDESTERVPAPCKRAACVPVHKHKHTHTHIHSERNTDLNLAKNVASVRVKMISILVLTSEQF